MKKSDSGIKDFSRRHATDGSPDDTFHDTIVEPLTFGPGFQVLTFGPVKTAEHPMLKGTNNPPPTLHNSLLKEFTKEHFIASSNSHCAPKGNVQASQAMEQSGIPGGSQLHPAMRNATFSVSQVHRPLQLSLQSISEPVVIYSKTKTCEGSSPDGVFVVERAGVPDIEQFPSTKIPSSTLLSTKNDLNDWVKCPSREEIQSMPLPTSLITTEQDRLDKHTQHKLATSQADSSILANLKGRFQTNFTAVLERLEESPIRESIEKHIRKSTSFSHKPLSHSSSAHTITELKDDVTQSPKKTKKKLHKLKHEQKNLIHPRQRRWYQHSSEDISTSEPVKIPRSHTFSAGDIPKSPSPYLPESVPGHSSDVGDMATIQRDSLSLTVPHSSTDPGPSRPVLVDSSIRPENSHHHYHDGDAETSTSSTMSFFAVLAAVFVFMLPLPDFVIGLIVGCFFTVVGVYIHGWFKKSDIKKEDVISAASGDDAAPFKDLPGTSASINDGLFKGWINESHVYDYRSHALGETKPVYLQLDGTVLYVYYTRKAVPHSIIWSDPPLNNVTFFKEDHYDLLGARVNLEPHGLVARRRWSKKYPIKITFLHHQKQDNQESESLTPVDRNLSSSQTAVLDPGEDNAIGGSSSRGGSTASSDDEASTSCDSSTERQPKKKRKSSARAFAGRLFGRLSGKSKSSADTTNVTSSVHNKGSTVVQPQESSVTVRSRASSKEDNIFKYQQSSAVATASAPFDLNQDVDSVSEKISLDEVQAKINKKHYKMRDGKTVFYFARTNREKELWFKRFFYASFGLPIPTNTQEFVRSMGNKMMDQHINVSTPPKDHMPSLSPSKTTIKSNKTTASKEVAPPEEMLRKYFNHMGKCVPVSLQDEGEENNDDNVSRLTIDSNGNPMLLIGNVLCDVDTAWLNGIVGRLFFDILHKSFVMNKLRERIQKKLNKIHRPYFIDALLLSEIDLGQNVPLIQRISKPMFNDQGMWLDLDIAYTGGFSLALETKLNLMKIKERANLAKSKKKTKEKDVKKEDEPKKEDSSFVSELPLSASDLSVQNLNAALNSDEEDSADSTDDHEDMQEDGSKAANIEPAGQRVLRLVDRIAESPYFRRASEYKFVKRAIENVSSTALSVAVNLHCLIGTVTINIPPPPTDRLWFGFRYNPRLILLATPKVGLRDVGKTRIAAFLQKKLTMEFERALVLPNMEDIELELLLDETVDNEETKYTTLFN